MQLGAIAEGTLHTAPADYAITSGVVVGCAGEWHALRAPASPVSLTLGLQLAVGAAQVRDAAWVTRPWVATDIRVSLTASRTFWDVITPYAAVRALGGPILWRQARRDAIGTDPRHVQLAVGAALALAPGFGVHLEWDYFGERGLFGGVSASF